MNVIDDQEVVVELRIEEVNTNGPQAIGVNGDDARLVVAVHLWEARTCLREM